jgi:hypothetical protein
LGGVATKQTAGDTRRGLPKKFLAAKPELCHTAETAAYFDD